MSSSSERYGFVPPTTPEQLQDEFAHLRVENPSDLPRFDQNPFELFDQIGTNIVAEEMMSAEDIVITLQHQTGTSLNTKDIRNLLGWATEEIVRHKDSEKLAIMTKTRRFKHLYGVDIIFDDPIPEEAAG